MIVPHFRKSYLFNEKTSYSLCLLVKLGAGQRLCHGSLAVEEGEEDVVGSRVVPPTQNLGDVVVPAAAALRSLLLETADVTAGGRREPVALD